MDNTPKVSVIIPVYNTEEYIGQCIESVLNQTLSNIEIIIINDGSTDDSLSILHRYQEKDSRITIINQINKGLPAARNSGMKCANGEYIYFLDSDDFIDINTLEATASIADEKNLEVVSFGLIKFGDEALIKSVFQKKTYIFGHLDVCSGVSFLKEMKDEGRYITSACLSIMRRSFLETLNINFLEGIIHEDNFFTFLVYMNAERVIQLPDLFYHRRVHSDSIMTTSKTGKNVIGYFKSAIEILRYSFKGEYELLKEQEIVRAFNEMISSTVSVYQSLPEYEKKSITFSNEMEKELFNILIIKNANRKELENIKEQLEDIRASRSFIIGRMITFIPRKIRGGVRCYQKYGLKFTKDQLLYHLKLKEDCPAPVKKDYDYYRMLPPGDYPKELKSWYKERTGKTLNLHAPKTFNEKIQWMKLYDSTPLKTQLADKYLVREWVANKVGEEYLVPLLGVWDSFDEIDFDKLPDQFVLKANHGSGCNIIVKDKSKLDRADARAKFNIWLQRNFAFVNGFELHYMNIQPKIIAEEYIENAEGLIDYRFYSFNGRPEQVWVDIFSGTPNHLRSIYDMNWKLLPIKCTWPEGGALLSKRPDNFEKMKDFAEKLSQEFAFVRVDFFEVDGKLFVGEMTFTPMSGTGNFAPKEWDMTLGRKLHLPSKSSIPEHKR